MKTFLIAGKFPSVNETVVSGDFDFTVMEVEKNRLKTVQVHINMKRNEG